MEEKYKRFIEDCKFKDGSFNFRSFYFEFIKTKVLSLENEYEEKKKRKENLEEKEIKKKERKLKKMISYRKIEENENYNPFFNIQKSKKEYEFVKKLEDLNYINEYYNTIFMDIENPFWLSEDEKYFGKSLITIKKESVPKEINNKDPFLILQNKKNILSIKLSYISQMKDKIKNVIENTKKLQDEDFIPCNPIIQNDKNIKKKVSPTEEFMINIMNICSLGHEHDPDEGITKLFIEKKKKVNNYEIDFEKIKKYF